MRASGSRSSTASHDTSRIVWAKLLARVAEEFPLECPNCGGDIRLIAFITEPGPIRKILAHLAEPLEPPPPARSRQSRRAAGLGETPRTSQKTTTSEEEGMRAGNSLVRAGRQEHATHEPLIIPAMVESVRLAGLSMIRSILHCPSLRRVSWRHDK
jgi:hypothetical protein